MILERILQEKRREVARAKRSKPLAALLSEILRAPKTKPFAAGLSGKKPIAVIAEIKRKSPSKGLIRSDFRPEWIAGRYQSAGAAALSVLTDRKFFGGSADTLMKVRRKTSLPILRKDFMVDDYQIYESRAMGADAVLLIAAALTAAEMKRMSALAKKLGMAALFEIHNAAEWKKIAPLKPKLVGINNRDLKTFNVDLAVFERLSKSVSKNAVLVAESGVYSSEDVLRMKKAGAKAVLVGESLMRQSDPGAALKKLLR